MGNFLISGHSSGYVEAWSSYTPPSPGDRCTFLPLRSSFHSSAAILSSSACCSWLTFINFSVSIWVKTRCCYRSSNFMELVATAFGYAGALVLALLSLTSVVLLFDSFSISWSRSLRSGCEDDSATSSSCAFIVTALPMASATVFVTIVSPPCAFLSPICLMSSILPNSTVRKVGIS